MAATDVDNDDKGNDPGIWVDLRPTAAIAQIFTFIALVIYLYTLVPQCMCCHFRPSFFRQVAYILQMIRLFLLMAALLPCVLHSQVRAVFPDLSGREFAMAVLLALVGNIVASIGTRRFFECNSDALCCMLHILPFMRSSCSISADPCVASCNCSCSPPQSCCAKPKPRCPKKNSCGCCPVPKPCSVRFGSCKRQPATCCSPPAKSRCKKPKAKSGWSLW